MAHQSHHRDTQDHQSNPRWLQQTGRSLLLVLLGAGLATAGAGTLQAVQRNDAEPAEAGIGQAAEQPVALSVPDGSSNAIAEMVRQVGPAVVRIDASRTVTTQLPEAFQNPLFRRFFGDIPESQERVQQGVGSGFILSEDGRIVTNAHVINDADTVQVTLKDGRTFEGEVLGTDPVTDVAVIDIEANDLPTVSLSDSDQIQPGQWAIAIGNPLGLDNTVTVGIVSGIGRTSGEVGVSDKRVNFIQTDAAINPGNSGGPLLNAQGEVIGMNTAIIQNAQGIGFAIPINKVEDIAEQLIADGNVEHPFLGIRMVTLTPQVKASINQETRLDVQAEEGILIVEVLRGSPADEAGIRPGDILLSVGGESVEDAQDVQQQVEESRIGEDLSVEVRRDNEVETLTVQPQPLPVE